MVDTSCSLALKFVDCVLSVGSGGSDAALSDSCMQKHTLCLIHDTSFTTCVTVKLNRSVKTDIWRCCKFVQDVNLP